MKTPKQTEEAVINAEESDILLPNEVPLPVVKPLSQEQISALLKMEHPECVRSLSKIGVLNLGWILDLVFEIHEKLGDYADGFNADCCTTAGYLMHFPEFPVSMLLRPEIFAEELLDLAYTKSDDILRIQSIIAINCNGTEIRDIEVFRQYCFNTAIDFKVI